MHFHVITVFPELIEASLKVGVVGQAVARGQIRVDTLNPRKFAIGVHQALDDKPFGGSDGMLMFGDPLVASLNEIRLTRGAAGESSGATSEQPSSKALQPPAQTLGSTNARVIHLSPRGRPLTDMLARELASHDDLVLIASRYAGLDQRFINEFVDDEISIGDYVLSGGELAALVVIDAVARLLPGVLGNKASSYDESFATGLLEEPQFTRPREWRGVGVPPALLSGDHAAVARWRKGMAILTTLQKRPDLITQALSEGRLREGDLAQARALFENSSSEDLRTCGLDTESIEQAFQDLVRGRR